MLSIVRKTERRRQARDPINVSLPILSTDPDGRETVMHARLLDISLSGARLGLGQRIPTHSVVTFYYHKLRVGGRGTVRYCRSAKAGYEVGLEFPNGTGWSPAARDKVDLLNLAAAIQDHESTSPSLPAGTVVFPGG